MEFYWAVLQLIDRDNDGMLSITEFEESSQTLTDLVAFGESDSLLDWFKDNAIRINANNGRQLTSRAILAEVGQGDLTDDDFMALDILIYYADSFYSMPGWGNDGIMLMFKLEEAIDELAEALSQLDHATLFEQLDANGDDLVVWEEVVPMIQSTCESGGVQIANFEPLPEIYADVI